MDLFLKFVENREFVRWVIHPDEQSDAYWKEYLSVHPDEMQPAETARYLISQLRSKKEDINEDTATRLYSEIVCNLSKKKQGTRSHLHSLLKYAAVAAVFFIGGFFSYYQISRNSVNTSIPQVSELNNMDEARLILSDGKYISLNEKESVIDYHNGKSIVINNHDTIQTDKKTTVPELNQLVIPYGKNSSLTLADGTVVHLNSGSRLTYPDFFSGKTREVVLFGEAFFDVAPDADMPFIVRTNEINVEALGTRFNVSAYPSDNMIETVLVEGMVKVIVNNNKVINKEYVLHPNELASFNRETLATEVKPVDIANFVSWHEGFLNFESIDLSRIVKRIERYYDINIRLDNPMVGQLKISGKLKLKEDKDNILKVVACTASLEVLKINERYYVLK